MPFTTTCPDPSCKKKIVLIPFEYRCGCQKNELVKDLREKFSNHNTADAHINNSNPTSESEEKQMKETKIFLRKKKKKEEIKELAWLFVHTKGKDEVFYPIVEGQNFFGRADEDENIEVDIPIEGDDYVSRAHACIIASKAVDGSFSFQIRDNGDRRNGKPSTNGTFINENDNRLESDQVYEIKHDDTIQVGETALIFQQADKVSLKKAETRVLNRQKATTVVIGS